MERNPAYVFVDDSMTEGLDDDRARDLFIDESMKIVLAVSNSPLSDNGALHSTQDYVWYTVFLTS